MRHRGGGIRWFRRATQALLAPSLSDMSVVTTTFTPAAFGWTADGVTTNASTLTARGANSAVLPSRAVTYAARRRLVSASLSTLSTTPGTIANDGVDSASSTITIRNTAGDPVVGFPAANCVMAVSGAGNTVTQPVGSSDYAGRITGSFVSTVAASKTVSWTIKGLAITDTDTVVVTAGAITGRANEPSGFAVISEWNNESALAAESWTVDGPTTWGSKSRVTSGYEGTPTIGGSAVMLTAQTGGTDGGMDPQRLEYHGLSGHGTELYFSVEAQWAGAGPTDYPFSTAPGGGKQLILWFTGGGRYIWNLDASTNRWNIYENSTLTYNPLVGQGTFAGQRTFVELEGYCNRGTGAADGTLRFYQAGTLVLEETGVTFPAGDFDYFVVDHASNGNRYPTGSAPETRKIGTHAGGPLDTSVWTSAMYLSRP